jgi:5-(hydroxymethyl)furfural/furfural oxidase
MHLMAFNKTAWHALGMRVGMIAVSVLQSHSKGYVELSSADPAELPIVHFNLLSDPRDFERLVAGSRFALELLTDPSVASQHREIFFPRASIVSHLARRNLWNSIKARAIAHILDHDSFRRILLAEARIEPETLLSEESALRDFVRRNAGPQFHDCGTCRMGRANDFVVDASIFPSAPRGYPHFIVLMAAEKIADTIKAD